MTRRITMRGKPRRLFGAGVVVLSLVLVNATAPAAARPLADGAGQAVAPAGSGKVVPVSADVQTTRTTAGQSGQETSHLVRDGQGRTRLESGPLVTITDPTTGTTSILNTQTRTYLTAKAPKADRQAPAANGSESLRPTISPIRQLGTAQVSQVPARGYGYTITSPRPGAKPVTKDLTLWVSGEVQLPVRTEVVDSTGASYQQSYTNIKAGVQPAADAFTVPAGYRDAGTTASMPGFTPDSAGVNADCPLFNAPDPLILFDFGFGYVQATTNPQIGCFFSAVAWAFVFPLIITPAIAGAEVGFAFSLFAAFDDSVTPSPCPFLPCPVPGDIVFQARNGNGDVIKDSAVVLTRFFF